MTKLLTIGNPKTAKGAKYGYATAILHLAGEAEPPADTHRLIGFACGPDRLTFSAMEEDHFPAPCDAVEAVGDVCPETPLDAVACLDYLGREGW
nr:hypothetical protein [uncultured Sphingomonas sp.]